VLLYPMHGRSDSGLLQLVSWGETSSKIEFGVIVRTAGESGAPVDVVDVRVLEK